MIGINADFRPARKDVTALSWLNTGYYDAVCAAGGIPVIIPPLAEEEDLKQILATLDGVVLTGCALDLDPSRIGQDLHPSTRKMSQRREDFDRRLARLAVEMRLPVIAIGGGMQLLNVVCGGTVLQSIPEAFNKPLHHCDPVEKNLRHIIEIVPGTRLDSIYGPGEIRVNSQHHLAVDQVAGVFRVSAASPDGVVEAYESTDEDWFCIGVQWHPENDTASALDMQVFENFVTACEEPEPTILRMPVRAAA